MSNYLKTEKKLRLWLASHLGGHWQPVEDCQSVGVPDTNFAIDNGEGWAELKVVYAPKNHISLVNVKLRPAQYAWMRIRERHHGVINLVISLPKEKGLMIIKDTVAMHRLLAPLRYCDLCDMSVVIGTVSTNIKLIKGVLVS